MTTAMFDAREAMIPGSQYDRSGMMNGGGEYRCIVNEMDIGGN